MGTDATNLSDAALTEAVLASFAGAASPRFKQIAERLVTHLHAFVADVEPTEAEWFAAIDFLTRTGHITDDRRQEFVLLSDVLGVSMQVIGINHRAPSGATESTVFGPFFVEGSPGFANGDDIAAGAPGQPCFVSGRVLSVGAEPIAGARIEVWQADEDGFYDVQFEGDEVRGRGHLESDGDGRFWFRTVLPEAYPIPDDGPVGELLAAGARSPMRPAHVHFMIDAPGCERLITHVFAAGDAHLGSDAVFGVKDSLVADYARHDPGTGPDGEELAVPWYTMEYDFVLAARSDRGGA
jgi:hydroxyquinol 1,2-dioxygenase